jgi:hypothetical protein
VIAELGDEGLAVDQVELREGTVRSSPGIEVRP